MDKQQSRREALAKRVYGMCWPQEAGWPTWCGAHEVAQRRAESVADFIIAEQERREGPLVEALESIGYWPKDKSLRLGVDAHDAREALAAYRAIDAPPQRTVEQIAADVVRLDGPILCGSDIHELNAAGSRWRSLMDELAAALKRAEGERNAEGVKRGKE